MSSCCVVKIVNMCVKVKTERKEAKNQMELKEYKVHIEPKRKKQENPDEITTVESSIVVEHDTGT